MKHLSLFVSLAAVVATVFTAAPVSAKQKKHYRNGRVRVVRVHTHPRYRRVYAVPRYRRTGSFARMYNRNYRRTRGLRYGRVYQPWTYRNPYWSRRRTVRVWNGDQGRWHARPNGRAVGWDRHPDKAWKHAEKRERNAEKHEGRGDKHEGRGDKHEGRGHGKH